MLVIGVLHPVAMVVRCVLARRSGGDHFGVNADAESRMLTGRAVACPLSWAFVLADLRT